MVKGKCRVVPVLNKEICNEDNFCLAEHHDMKTNGTTATQLQTTLTLALYEAKVVSFMPWSYYPWGQSPVCTG